MASKLLGRTELLEAFGLLAAGLAQRRIHADVYVVDGAAMSLAWSDRRTTRDVDALFRTNRHHAFLEEVREVARQLDLPRSWLNEQATAYMPEGIELEASVVWDSPSLRVFVASPELVLAMKTRACRATDADDIATLMTLLHIRSLRRVIAIHDRYFPNDQLGDDKRAALQAIIEPA